MEQRSKRLSDRMGDKPRTIARDISESLGKLPPQALDLEEAILGAAILEGRGKTLPEVMGYLQPDHFYLDSHKEIFIAIKALFLRNDPVDMRTVVAELRSNGKLEIVGGAFYVAELSSKVSSAANIGYHSQVLVDYYIKRECIQLASTIHHHAYEDETDVVDLIEMLEKGLQGILGGIQSQSIVPLKEGLFNLIQEISKRTENKHGITGVPSGFLSLDRITHGWQQSDLVTIAARPGMGKTAFLLTTLRNAAIQFNEPVAIVSVEMATVQLIQRLVAMETGISLKKIRGEMFNQLDYSHLTNKISKLSDAPFYIIDASSMSITELRTVCRQLKQKYGVKLIGVDYLQLLKGDKETLKKGNREQEIASITRGLKACAKELNLPIILLSQLSREVEKRGGAKIPQLSDLRESGSIEQDSDIVGFLWRPEYYKMEGDSDGTFTQGLTKLIIAKHRNGSLMDAFLTFVGNTTSFKDCEHMYTHNEPPAGLTPASEALAKAEMQVNKTDDDAPF